MAIASAMMAAYAHFRRRFRLDGGVFSGEAWSSRDGLVLPSFMLKSLVNYRIVREHTDASLDNSGTGRLRRGLWYHLPALGALGALGL